ncbi:jg5245, partial [Pararge aegeria aegeria]
SACVELNRKSLMVEEAVEEVLDLVKKAAQQAKPIEINPDFEFLIADGNNDAQMASGAASTMNESTTSGQQDWSAVWECFESPHRLLSVPAGGLSKSMQEMVKNAVSEMRRYYSRKVIDVLIKVTRRALDLIIKQFTQDESSGK